MYDDTAYKRTRPFIGFQLLDHEPIHMLFNSITLVRDKVYGLIRTTETLRAVAMLSSTDQYRPMNSGTGVRTGDVRSQQHLSKMEKIAPIYTAVLRLVHMVQMSYLPWYKYMKGVCNTGICADTW